MLKISRENLSPGSRIAIFTDVWLLQIFSCSCFAMTTVLRSSQNKSRALFNFQPSRSSAELQPVISCSVDVYVRILASCVCTSPNPAFFSLFNGLHRPLCCTAECCSIVAPVSVVYRSSSRRPEPLGRECRAIVQHNNVSQALACKDMYQTFNGNCCGWSRHWIDPYHFENASNTKNKYAFFTGPAKSTCK